MNTKEPYEIIARYLSGEATAQERDELEQWKKLSDENAEAFDQLELFWNKTATMNFEPDTEKALASVSAKINKKKALPIRLIVQIAAVLVICIGTVYYFKTRTTPLKPLMYVTGKNETKTILLEDGTNVTLNENSTLTVPGHFDDSTRKVTFEGEAYFNVAKNPHKAFIIKAGESVTRVLGTAFLVRARKNETYISVSVHRGKVSFSKASNNVILTVGEIGVLNKKTGNLLETINDNLNDLSWQTKMLTFIATPLPKAISQISDYYNVSILIDNPELCNLTFTSQFTNKKLDEVLKTIELTTGHSFVKDGNMFILK